MLAPLGMTKLREWPEAAIGFGKKLSGILDQRARRSMDRVAEDSGVHICLRAPDAAAVDAFHAAALRPAANPTARRACGRNITRTITPRSSAIWDGNRIEAVTFLREG